MKDLTQYGLNSKDGINVTDLYLFQIRHYPLNKQSLITIIEKL